MTSMNFRNRRTEEPEINLIPFIDVLLVVLIFLMLTTSFSKFTELQLNLPQASADRVRERPQEIVVAVTADGRYAVNRELLQGGGVELLSKSLAEAARAQPEAVLIISADAAASHQAVISVMEAARRTGLTRVTFATQAAGESRGR